MLDIGNGYPWKIKEIINIILDEVFTFFMEVGSHLEIQDIYATVFPLHKQNNDEFIMNKLRQLHLHIRDDFIHRLSPMEKYILYYVLYYVYESSDDGFDLSRMIAEQLTDDITEGIDDECLLKSLRSIHTPYDLTGLIFEDIDFLNVGEIFELYRNNPKMVTDFFHINLDYYKELMPPDIISEYEFLEGDINDFSTYDENKNVEFNKEIVNVIEYFKHLIEHQKVHQFLHTSNGPVDEKTVQLLFNTVAELYLKESDILIHSEPDLGRGKVDFYFSIGKSYKALVELKLCNHSRYEDGIKYQLPTYLMADDTHFGVFVLICYTEEQYKNSETLYEVANNISYKYNKKIKLIRINASGTLKAASNINRENEMGFDD